MIRSGYTDYLFYKNLGKDYLKSIDAGCVDFDLDITELGMILKIDMNVDGKTFRTCCLITIPKLRQSVSIQPSKFKFTLRRLIGKRLLDEILYYGKQHRLYNERD
jgi:hypothetical protein